VKVALALSGGGIRAVAHLGIIRVLIDNGFKYLTIRNLKCPPLSRPI